MTQISQLMALFSTPLGAHLTKLSLAFVLVILAILAAKLVQMAFTYILKAARLDDLSKKIGLEDTLKKAELKSSAAELLGDLAFWATIIKSGILIIYSMNFVRAIIILREVLKYLSVNVVNGVFVLSLSVIFAYLVYGLIMFIGSLIYLPGYKLIARVNQYAIVIFGIVAGLGKLGVPTASLFRPDIILGFFALAGAIAFGLGCKDIAASWLANFLRDR